MNENFDDDDSEVTFLACAERVAKTIENLDARSEVISLIALKHAEAGQLETAAGVAEAIEDTYLRDQTFARIVGRCVQAGAAEYAETLAESIDDETAYAQATEEMAVAYAVSGELEKAIEAAHRLDDSAPALSRIALVCVNAGQTAEGLRVARSIDYPDLKAPILAELAGKAIEGGRADEADELIREAHATTEEIEFFEQRVSAMVMIASLEKRREAEDAALKTLIRARDLCDESEDIVIKDTALAQIAPAFAELQRYEQADQSIEEIESPFQFAQATIGVAREYHRSGDTTTGLKLLAEASEIVRNEEIYGERTLSMRENALDELARSYALIGHYDEAVQMTESMDETHRHRSLAEIARLCVSSGNNNRAFQVAGLIEDNFARVLCEIGIVDAFSKAEQLELANHALAEAFARTAAIDQTYQKVFAMIEVAQRFARREQAAKASEVLFEALTTAASIESKYLLPQALISLADKYVTLGQEPGQRERQVLEGIIRKLD